MAILQKSHTKTAIKHQIRQLARVSNPAKGYQSVEDVDADLTSMFLQGYKLVNTHYIGSQKDPETAVEYFGVLYIWQLEQSEIERMKQEKKAQEKVSE